ncbi:MAG: tRNA preQ1(34) S-adenosylmethionine ribosyltransferase-isomerase QueA [Kiloniellales bacterium]
MPRAAIAQHPVSPRDAARLLSVDKSLEDRNLRDLPGLLRPGDLLVVNDTRVIPARLFGRRGEAKVEVTLTAPEAVEPGAGARWRALARPAKRLKPGDRIDFGAGLAARVAAKGARGEITLDFDLAGAAFSAALERAGVPPLPPYIKREAGGAARDRDDYQTIFAARAGAVAAPTAGLHFTEELLAALDKRGVGRATVTLHVGAGTFLPVTAEDPRDHRMHAEWGEITESAAAAVNTARAAGGRVIAVGSTALRLLETAARDDGRLDAFSGETDIFILPGARFKAVDMMLTNFHLPRSTLFMLVCAFAGTARMKRAYDHAISQGYRFFSYGDACLLHLDREHD